MESGRGMLRGVGRGHVMRCQEGTRDTVSGGDT